MGDTKLLPQRLGPYHVITVGLEYINICEDGIENTVYSNPITKAPHANHEINDIEDKILKKSKAERAHQPKEWPRQKYTVQWIVGHKKNPIGVRYHVRWYCYKPADDTYEHISPRTLSAAMGRGI